MELIQQTTTADVKKKAIEERQRYTVQMFCKTFNDLNHREPMEAEIINNLSDTIDADMIKRILTELSKGDSLV
jgi:hypothetical protein